MTTRTIQTAKEMRLAGKSNADIARRFKIKESEVELLFRPPATKGEDVEEGPPRRAQGFYAHSRRYGM